MIFFFRMRYTNAGKYFKYIDPNPAFAKSNLRFRHQIYYKIHFANYLAQIDGYLFSKFQALPVFKPLSEKKSI